MVRLTTCFRYIEHIVFLLLFIVPQKKQPYNLLNLLYAIYFCSILPQTVEKPSSQVITLSKTLPNLSYELVQSVGDMKLTSIPPDIQVIACFQLKTDFSRIPQMQDLA